VRQSAVLMSLCFTLRQRGDDCCCRCRRAAGAEDCLLLLLLLNACRMEVLLLVRGCIALL
jgi:hypothetical protein